MKYLNDISLLDILPSSIKNDEKIIALASALDIELQKLSNETKLPLHLPRLEELPHEVLNELAWAYHVDFFEPEKMDLSTKRLLISNAILQHRKYGTQFAVEKLLNTLSRGAKISTWFNYDGLPYHFKVNLKGLQDLSDDGERIWRAIEVAKSVRDTIDDFDFDLSKEHPDEILHFGILQLFLGKIFYELCTQFEDRHKLKVRSNEIFSGDIFYSDEINLQQNLNLRAGFFNLMHGKIKYDAEIEEISDDLWYKLFLNWIRSKWKYWHAAEIIRDSDSDDDDDEKEDEIINGEFLKLYLDFHNSDHIRSIKIYFPRENLTGADINAVDVDNFFVYRKKFFSNKIIRATYINKVETKMFF